MISSCSVGVSWANRSNAVARDTVMGYSFSGAPVDVVPVSIIACIWPLRQL